MNIDMAALHAIEVDRGTSMCGPPMPPLTVTVTLGDGTLEVMLLTSRGTKRWVIPKGWPHDSLSSAGSAAQEAWEEAGVRGPVTETPVGSFRYEKIRDEGGSVTCVVHVHAMKVVEQLPDWPEKGQREFQWFPRQTAALQVHEPGLRELILSFAPPLPYA